MRLLPERRLPADWSFPGHCPAHDARCPAVGNTLMSTPISAISSSAVRFWTPGIVHRSSACLTKDVMSSPSDPTCRDLLSSSAERVRAGFETVELEEAPSEHRNGT